MHSIKKDGDRYLGEYPESNRKLTVPHTVVLPIELYPPLFAVDFVCYSGMIRTFNSKYQKFMTYLLVYGIFGLYEINLCISKIKQLLI